MEVQDDVDDMPQLSEHALAALKEFYTEKSLCDEKEHHSAEAAVDMESALPQLQEDWQLSQFWYTDATATSLAKEACRIAGDLGSIACVSCPTVYKKIRELKNCGDVKVKLFEYDRRFSAYGSDYVFYDYNEPLDIAMDFKGKFDVVLSDPPFLSDECLTKTACTIKLLSRGKIILCTGAVMDELANRLLGLHICKFEPQHVRSLGNIFKCYSNYNLDDFITSS